ncbi:MAG: hypothetical protein AB1342_15590 [Pseudomonadota bacterium]|jgi:hypothetical protein
MFMYSIIDQRDLSEHGNALARDEQEALAQIQEGQRRLNKPVLNFKIDESGNFVLEKRGAVRFGQGWRNDGQGPIAFFHLAQRD